MKRNGILRHTHIYGKSNCSDTLARPVEVNAFNTIENIIKSNTWADIINGHKAMEFNRALRMHMVNHMINTCDEYNED